MRQVNVLSNASAQSSDLMVINIDLINKSTRLYCACACVRSIIIIPTGFAGADTWVQDKGGGGGGAVLVCAPPPPPPPAIK